MKYKVRIYFENVSYEGLNALNKFMREDLVEEVEDACDVIADYILKFDEDEKGWELPLEFIKEEFANDAGIAIMDTIKYELMNFNSILRDHYGDNGLVNTISEMIKYMRVFYKVEKE